MEFWPPARHPNGYRKGTVLLAASMHRGDARRAWARRVGQSYREIVSVACHNFALVFLPSWGQSLVTLPSAVVDGHSLLAKMAKSIFFKNTYLLLVFFSYIWYVACQSNKLLVSCPQTTELSANRLRCLPAMHALQTTSHLNQPAMPVSVAAAMAGEYNDISIYATLFQWDET